MKITLPDGGDTELQYVVHILVDNMGSLLRQNQ